MKTIRKLPLATVTILLTLSPHAVGQRRNVAADASQQSGSQIVRVSRETSDYAVFRRFYDDYFAAWNAAFPANLDAPARFYAQDAGLTFYDPSPTREGAIVDGPIGWAGLREHFERNIFPNFASFSFNFAPKDDLRVWRRGDVAWASFIWRTSAQKKDGRAQEIDGRQSNVFERRGGRWVIVHEHASVPVPEGVTQVRAGRVVPLGTPLANQDAEFQRMINDYAAQWHAQNGNPPDWDGIARYYATDADIVLIDASPFQPNIGFAAFRVNAQRTFYDPMAFWTFAANPDAQAVRRGDVAWTTFTARVMGRFKNGQTIEQDLRQSNVWERRAGRWVIVHEHGSVPLPGGDAPQTAPAATRN